MTGPISGDRAPLPVALLVVAAGVLAFTTDQPLVLVALAIGGLVLLRAAPGHPGRLVLIGALLSAIGVFVLTPLVSGQGDLVLFSLPMPPPLNGDITAEAVAVSDVAPYLNTPNDAQAATMQRMFDNEKTERVNAARRPAPAAGGKGGGGKGGKGAPPGA